MTKPRLVHILGSVAAATAVLATPLTPSRAAGDEHTTVEAIRRVKPSVVAIETSNPASRTPGIGSGVVLRRDGFILTNWHVLKRAQTIRVSLPGGRSFPGSIWQSNRDRDLAVVKVDAQDLPVPRFGNSDKIELGQNAIAIGSPLRFKFSVTQGIISATGRDITASDIHYRNLLQTDAAINPGSSGGALINSAGEVIGINTLVYTGTEKYPHAQGLAFAIPINDALKTAQSLLGKQALPSVSSQAPAWLGIEGKDVTRDLADASDFKTKLGVLVREVKRQSPAAAAGLKKSDVITEADATPVRSLKDLRTVLSRHHAGDTVEFVVWTLGKTRRTVKINFDSGAQP